MDQDMQLFIQTLLIAPELYKQVGGEELSDEFMNAVSQAKENPQLVQQIAQQYPEELQMCFNIFQENKESFLEGIQQGQQMMKIGGKLNYFVEKFGKGGKCCKKENGGEVKEDKCGGKVKKKKCCGGCKTVKAQGGSKIIRTETNQYFDGGDGEGRIDKVIIDKVNSMFGPYRGMGREIRTTISPVESVPDTSFIDSKGRYMDVTPERARILNEYFDKVSKKQGGGFLQGLQDAADARKNAIGAEQVRNANIKDAVDLAKKYTLAGISGIGAGMVSPIPVDAVYMASAPVVSEKIVSGAKKKRENKKK